MKRKKIEPKIDVPKEPKRLTVGVELLADALNITPRRVQQFKKDGTFKDAGRGQYDLVECSRAYIRFLMDAYKRPEAVTNLTSERLRGEVLTNNERELNLGARTYELIPVAIAAALWEQIINQAKARVIASGNRLKREIVELNDTAKAVATIDDRVREILHELVAIEPADYVHEAKASIVPTGGKANRKSVGG
jgi:hypothetical protein